MRPERDGIENIPRSGISRRSIAATSDSARLRIDVEFALKLVGIHPRAPRHENLFDVRLRCARHAADRAAVDRRIPPAENTQPFFLDDALDDSLGLQALMLLDRQEHHADAVLARRRQRETERRRLAREKLVRDLNQHPGAVAGFRVAAACAPMRQVDEDLNPFFDDVVGFLALDVGHKAHAAGVMLVARVVKPLALGQAMDDRFREG